MRYAEATQLDRDLLRDVVVAVSRFGNSDRKVRLRWLLDFVDRDLGMPEAARDAALQACVFALAGRVTGEGGNPPARMDALSSEALDPRQVREAFSSVGRLQREVKEALTAFASDGRCTLPFKIVGLERLPDGRVLPIVGGDWRSRFYGAVFMLAVELGPDLAVCANPKCRKLLLRSRRQGYCTPQCSQRQRTQSFRERHPERVRELRHATHARRQRRRLGPRVRVERRPRRTPDHRRR